jgi:hypothetical protein
VSPFDAILGIPEEANPAWDDLTFGHLSTGGAPPLRQLVFRRAGAVA